MIKTICELEGSHMYFNNLYAHQLLWRTIQMDSTRFEMSWVMSDAKTTYQLSHSSFTSNQLQFFCNVYKGDVDIPYSGDVRISFNNSCQQFIPIHVTFCKCDEMKLRKAECHTLKNACHLLVWAIYNYKSHRRKQDFPVANSYVAFEKTKVAAEYIEPMCFGVL